MDKLQPIIKHHFWIVTGELAAEINDRTTALDSTFSGIANGQNAANDDWANGVNQLIAIRKEANRLALDRLWNAQRDLMLWPPNVSKWMVDCPYRGEIEDARIRQILPDLYRDDYEREVRRVWLIPEPIDDGKTRVDPGLKQKVVFPYEAMPRTAASKWTLLPPTWKEIWSAQEDLWLLSEVLGSVREANASTSSITDSYVKQILQVQLFGGKRAAAPSGSSGSSVNPEFASAMPGMTMPMANRNTPGTLSKPAEFPTSEEYEVASTGARAMTYDTSSAESSDSGSPAAAVDPTSDESRYIQVEEAYRTRGFKLKVAIHQMQVPNLIRALLNTQYPIEIVRFQQSAMNPEEPGKPTNNMNRYPGNNSFSGLNTGFPGADTGEYTTDSASLESFSSSEESFGFDGAGSGPDGLAGKAYTVPALANVQAALQDRDLVELVVIGEIYLYNPPVVDESAAEADAPDAVASSDPATVDNGTAPAVDATEAGSATVPADAATQPTAPLETSPPSDESNNTSLPPENQPTTTSPDTPAASTDSPPASDSATDAPATEATASDASAPPASDGGQGT